MRNVLKPMKKIVFQFLVFKVWSTLKIDQNYQKMTKLIDRTKIDQNVAY